MILFNQNKGNDSVKSYRFWLEETFMKGFTVESGYMGFVNGSYILFASESDYMEYISE